MPKMTTEQKEILQAMEDHWYASLAIGAPDFCIYDSDAYVLESQLCFDVYSSKHIKEIAKVLPQDLKTIVDLGCGSGLTTALLASTFKESQVTGTQLKTSKQYQLCKDKGLNVVSDIAALQGPVDLVFASEYFEHIYKPIEHVLDVIAKLAPEYIVTANSFNTKASGHFLQYEHLGTTIPQDAISRKFNTTLRASGYQTMKTGFWDSRPTVWKRTQVPQDTLFLH